MAGEKTAVELALEARAEDPPEEKQLELLGLPVNTNVVELREERVKIGRPPGARNRRTVEMAEYLLSRYTSPLEVLAQIATARIDELAASLGCTKLEALQEKRLAAIALKDHLHSKMPIAVDLREHKIINLNIIDDAGAAVSVDGDGDTITLTATVLKDMPPNG